MGNDEKKLNLKQGCEDFSCETCPQTECLRRVPTDPEDKTFVTNSEMLEQMLRNLLPLMEDVCYWRVADNLSAQTISERIAETEALLARKD